MKLIFFSHANRIKRVGKIDDCDDREWKISPRRGDGNQNLLLSSQHDRRMEDKSPKRGRKLFTRVCYEFIFIGMEDKSPKRGRKGRTNSTY